MYQMPGSTKPVFGWKSEVRDLLPPFQTHRVSESHQLRDGRPPMSEDTRNSLRELIDQKRQEEAEEEERREERERLQQENARLALQLAEARQLLQRQARREDVS